MLTGAQGNGDAPVVAEQVCTVCGNAHGNHVHTTREMMFGTRERFDYLECAECGSLELLDVPSDLSPYYPPDYYSFAATPALRKGRLHFARKLRTRTALRSRRLARVAFGSAVPSWVAWFEGLGLPTSVLDVGCGSGQTLFNLWQEGFSCLTGCDPYLDKSRDLGEVHLVRADPSELDGRFDAVTALDAFEHMPDPHRTIDVLRRLAVRRIVLHVPVPGSSWRTYGVDWYGLDAPRHLHLITPQGMSRLAEAHGLRIVNWYFAPLTWHLWASEQYAADIPLYDERSYFENPTVLSPEQVADYERRARAIIAAGDGDQATFLLEPV